MVVRLNRFLKWFQGYLIIQIYGGSFDQIFRMCKAHKISLWQIDIQDDYLYAAINKNDILDFSQILKKSNSKVKVISKKGFPFFLKKVIKKIYFYIFIILLAFTLKYTQCHIWAIEINGNFVITDDEIMDYLSNEHIYYGMKQKDMLCDDLELKMRDQFPVLTWVSIYMKGTKLHIDLKENDLQVDEKKETIDSIYTNIDGEIVSVLVKQGEPFVKKGDKVQKGDILISGKVPVYDEELNVKDYQIINPEATVKILTNEIFHDVVENTYAVTQFYPNTKTYLFVELFGKRYYFNKWIKIKGLTETLCDKKQVAILKHVYLPVFYGHERIRKVDVQYFVYTDKEMKDILSDNLSKYILCLRRKGVQIIEKNVKISKNGSSMYLDADIQVIETIE